MGSENFDKINMHIFKKKKKSPDLWGLKNLINMHIFSFFFFICFCFLFCFFFFIFFFFIFFFICFSFFFFIVFFFFFLHFFNYLYIKRIPWDALSCLSCTSTVVAIMGLMNSCIKYGGIEHLREVAILGLVVQN